MIAETNRKPTQKSPPLLEDEYQLDPEGLPDDRRKAGIRDLLDSISVQKGNFLGYQANQSLDYKNDVSEFLDIHVNNIGDPFSAGNFTINSKVMERAVLAYYARLWNGDAHGPYNPKSPDPESYWGYVLTMGSTEGNLYGLWNARDYLSGRKLMVEPASKGNGPRRGRAQKYLTPKPMAANPNAYSPVAFFSEDTHYSNVKALRVLQIPSFCEMGRERYPGQNPLPGSGGSWEGIDEVPSKGGKPGPGSIDIDALATLVEFFASQGHPIFVCCNFGTTFKGAYDDVGQVAARLRPIFLKFGLVDRKVEYETGHTDIRNGYWIHVDGALGASYMPFLEMAYEKKGIEMRLPCFDFRIHEVSSIVMSGHKWPGAPWPCGIYMTKVKSMLFPPDDPEYIGSPDTTFAGSRNGFSAIILWDYLAKHSYQTQIEEAWNCEMRAQEIQSKLLSVADYHRSLDLRIDRTQFALTVRFRKPNPDIVRKYSLSCETLEIDGEKQYFAHVYAMKSADPEAVDRLIEDLKDPSAFDLPPDHALRTAEATPVWGRGWR